MTVISNFLTSGHSDAQSRASECLDVKNYKWRFNPVWHRMLYSCTRMAAVGVKWLRMFKAALHILCVFSFDCCVYRSCIYGVTYTVAIQTQTAIETDSLSSCPQHPGFMDCLHYPARTSSTCRNRVRLTARLHGDGSLKRMIYAAAVNCRLDCQLARLGRARVDSKLPQKTTTTFTYSMPTDGPVYRARCVRTRFSSRTLNSK